jgi:hypothetical protein
MKREAAVPDESGFGVSTPAAPATARFDNLEAEPANSGDMNLDVKSVAPGFRSAICCN